ncbi:MAG TPA: SPOR domain-containing protein [Phaeodactylibacter sp.]|nr:SPOR domain-containing protein [Phaeodactylibacter sp.]
MRYITNLLVIAFSILAFTTTQANKNTNPNYVYTIHIGAFDKAQISDFDDIQSIGYVYAYPLRDDLMQVFLGGYDSRSAARKVLPSVQQSGYPDAYVMRKAFDEGDEVVTVQIGMKSAGEDLDYGKYLKAGTIYISQNNNQVRILTGQYMNEKVAQQRAIQLKKIGFKNAFVKTINTVQLIKVTDFETGGAVADEIVAVVITPKGEAEKPKKTPKSYDVLFKKTKNKPKGNTTTPDDVPTNYENNSKRIVIPAKKEKAVVLPKIRVKVKRTSAIELQKVLKAEGTYKKSLDGYYGKGTAKAYAAIKKQNRQVKKYLLLSNMMDSEENSSLKLSRLQAIINKVLDEPDNANSLLKAESSPLAKVYRAYILFQSEGPQPEVDRLMNGAIQQAFNKKKKLKNAPRFDYSATYSYQDLGQLLKHLNYIHAVSEDAEVPCWIFSQHPIEAANAFATGGENLRMQNCGGDFMSWEETKLLKAIAEDLDPAYGLDKEQQAAYTSKRAKLFIAPQKLTGDEAKEALIWHKTLWTEMEKWGNADPVHDQRVVALKVAYFQSQVRIEDYFMNKGFTYKEAKPLAMSVLRTIVGAHFVNYLKG